MEDNNAISETLWGAILPPGPFTSLKQTNLLMSMEKSSVSILQESKHGYPTYITDSMLTLTLFMFTL